MVFGKNLQMVRKNSLIVILIGPPGSGKGTQAELLAKKLNLFYFETSKIIEEKVKTAKKDESVAIKGKEYPLRHEWELWRTGMLCTPVVVSFLVKEKFNELAKGGRNLVIAGSPRTLPEGKEEMPLLEELYGKKNIKIFNIELSSKESIWRNAHRRICSKCRHPIPYFEGTKTLKRCQHCGAKLKKRKGLDDPETVKVRLSQYKTRTKPLLDYFKKLGLKVIEINGEQSIENVFKDIIKKFKQ